MKKKEPRICPSCGYWRIKGELEHSPICAYAKWEDIQDHQQKTQSSLNKLHKKEMLEDYRRKKRIGPPTKIYPSNKAKSHPQGNWPPIIGGGAVEMNPRRH